MSMKIIALAGGVGGAKLANGLAKTLHPENLTIIVNTGDDFTHFGLYMCPDLDTVCYNLAGISNPVTGWGRSGETWSVRDALSKLSAPDWFNLGDQDLATHLERSRRLADGQPLSQVTKAFCANWNIPHPILPMSDDPINTKILTKDGRELDFQDYFVKEKWQPIVSKVHFEGASTARPAPGVMEAIHQADLIVICPSNPLVSIDPILSIAEIRAALLHKPVVAVSPIIGGKAVKGPLAKMIYEMYSELPSAAWVAGYYTEHLHLNGYLIDNEDVDSQDIIVRQGIICMSAPTLMTTVDDQIQVANQVIRLGETILRKGPIL